MKRESDRYYDALGLLKKYRHADEEQAASMQSALEIMRNHHKHGEMYYWILYYSFLSPKACDNDQVVLVILQAHTFGVTKRNFYGRRRAAVYAFSECFLR